MNTRIRLIGSPSIEMGGNGRQLPGRKPWAVLAYLALGNRPSRADLAEMLFAEAADPLAAERWALVQVRRALAGVATVVERDRRLEIQPDQGTVIDTTLVLAGNIEPDTFEWIVPGELLAGFAFDDAPAFEQWLTLERHRVASALVDALRHSVVALARNSPRRALELAERALAIEPFDDSLHELAVGIRVASGDRQGAAVYIESLGARYRRELGIAVPERIRRPLDRPAPGTTNPLIDLRRSTAALLEFGQARMQAGDYAGAVDGSRRAADDAAASGDPNLERRALTSLASVLIHSVRGRDAEATALLERALGLAQEGADLAVTAEIERELGYINFLAARYGAAEAQLRRAYRIAMDAGDTAEAGRALTLVGACESDRAEFVSARATIERGLTLLDDGGDRRWSAYAGSFLARAEMRDGHAAESRVTARLAVGSARAAGWSSLVPWCLAQEGEAAFALGDTASAAETFGHAFALGCEIADPCWEGASLRGLALIDAHAGRAAQAAAGLREALDRCTRVVDTYRWVEALILTDLVLLENGRDTTLSARALHLTRLGPMPDLHRSLIPFASQTEPQTQAS